MDFSRAFKKFQDPFDNQRNSAHYLVRVVGIEWEVKATRIYVNFYQSLDPKTILAGYGRNLVKGLEPFGCVECIASITKAMWLLTSCHRVTRTQQMMNRTDDT